MNFDAKKVRAITSIKRVLKDKSFEEFKIGKTDDVVRREKEYKQNGYFFFEKVISCETLNEVNQLEKTLIEFFKSDEECSNKISGGGGCTSDSKEYYIYVALK